MLLVAESGDTAALTDIPKAEVIDPRRREKCGVPSSDTFVVIVFAGAGRLTGKLLKAIDNVVLQIAANEKAVPSRVRL